MAVDPISEALKIKPLITDELYQNYLDADKNTQRKFLNELGEDELLNMQLRLNNQFNVPDEEFESAFSSARRDFMTGGDYPTDPTGMPMYDMPVAGSQAQDFAQEIFAGMREKGFDYSGLQNNKLRRGLSFMDTAGEKEDFLTKNIGPEGVGWTEDKYGRYAIMPEFREQLGGTPGDMPLTIDNPGVYERGDIADLAGSSPEITATILASIASRNLGVMPAVLASGTAAGTAKGVEEGVETLAGLQQQTLGEVGKDVLAETALGATAELGGRALVGTGKFLFSPAEVRIPTGERGIFNLKTYTYAPKVDAASGPGVTETQTLVRELIEEGAIPDVAKATGRDFPLGFLASLGERIFGYNQQKNVVNVKYLQDKINGFLKEVDAEPFDPFMGKVFPKLGEAELGALIQFQKEKSKSAIETAIETSLETLKSAIKTESDTLRSQVGKPPANVGTELAENVNKAYLEFQESTTRLYNEADQLLGNKAVVPTSSIKREAQNILDDVPKTADGQYVGGVSEITLKLLQDIVDMPANVSATHMSALRTMFGNAGYSDEMLSGFGQKQFNMLKAAANEGFDLAVNNGVKGVRYIDKNGNLVVSERKMTTAEAERARAGLTKLKEATSTYGEGIAAFDNRLIKMLTNKDGVDPDLLLSKIISRNAPVKIKQFLDASTDPGAARKMLQSGHFDSMVANATDVEGNFSANSMLRQIKTLGTSFPALYKNSAPAILRSLEQLNTAQKFIPIEDANKIKNALSRSIESGNAGELTGVVKEYVKTLDEQSTFLKNNFNKALETKPPEEVIPWMTTKASSDDIVTFINYYSKEAPEVVAEFKQKFMINLLDNVYDTTKMNPVGVVLNGKNLLTVIQKGSMPKRLAATFGDDTAQALERFAEQASFLTTKGEGFAGGLVAMNIALNPLQNIGKLIKINILTNILSKPGTLRYLTTIIENPNARATGYAVSQLSADIIAQIAAEDSTVDPDQLEKMTLEVQNGLLGLTDEAFNNYENEEE
tara:strand:+ start:369 stop:3380 length:3012 start_codon:yes stop_codon:yes gene_type:complete